MHISDHMLNVLQKSDVYGLKCYWYVDDGYGNLTPVSTEAVAAANYSFCEVAVLRYNWG